MLERWAGPSRCWESGGLCWFLPRGSPSPSCGTCCACGLSCVCVCACRKIHVCLRVHRVHGRRGRVLRVGGLPYHSLLLSSDTNQHRLVAVRWKRKEGNYEGKENVKTAEFYFSFETFPKSSSCKTRKHRSEKKKYHNESWVRSSRFKIMMQAYQNSFGQKKEIYMQYKYRIS